MGTELREQPAENIIKSTYSDKITESGSLAVKTILEENQILFLAESIENRYNLEFQLQVITNIQKEVLKKEILLRSVHEINPEKIVEVIKKNNDSHGLVCYLLDNAFKRYQENNIPLSINVEISDITHPNFLNAVNIFSNRYNNVNSNFLTFEILENEELPKDENERRDFFENLRWLKKQGFKIALDDIGWRNEEWELLYSNVERIDEFFEEGVIDVVKLDMELVRELYLSSKEQRINLKKVRDTYKIPDSVEYSDIIDFIWKYYQKLGTIEIVAEWIEDEFWEKGKKVQDNIDVEDFMEFLSEKLWVTQFQWYALWKPQDPKNIKKSLN